MRKLRILTVILLAAVSITACSDVIPESVQNAVDVKSKELKSKAAEELKQALKDQISDFIESTDLQTTLGLSAEEQEEVSESIEDYLESYDSDPTQWKKALEELTKAINKLKEDGELKGLSTDELNKKLEEILENQK